MWRMKKKHETRINTGNNCRKTSMITDPSCVFAFHNSKFTRYPFFFCLGQDGNMAGLDGLARNRGWSVSSCPSHLSTSNKTCCSGSSYYKQRTITQLICQEFSLTVAPNFAHYDELVLGVMARWRDDLHVCRPHLPLQRSVPHRDMANYPRGRDRAVAVLPIFGKRCVISAFHLNCYPNLVPL